MSHIELIESDRDTAPATRPAHVQTNTTPADLLRMAVAQNADLDRLERLMLLQERWETNQAIKAYNEAMAAFGGEAVEILKRKEVDFQTAKGRTHYWHAELSDVVSAVKPVLARHGFSYRWDTKQDRDWLEVTCILKHRLGHFETCTMGGPPDESGGKNRIQGFKSTKSYLERQTLEAICGVAEKGEDDDGRGGDEPAPTPTASPRAQKAPFPADSFAQSMKAWQKAVNKGKTPDEVLATVQQFNPDFELLAEQRAAILALTPAEATATA